jgi:flagellar hook-basal body complex protein FliE
MTAIPPVGALGAGGPEWQIAGIGSPDAAPAAGSGGGFGNVLTQQIGNLAGLQESAATDAQSLAAGTATDVSSVVTAVEKAQLAMQLAGQIRTRAAEAVNDIFHTQI